MKIDSRNVKPWAILLSLLFLSTVAADYGIHKLVLTIRVDRFSHAELDATVIQQTVLQFNPPDAAGASTPAPEVRALKAGVDNDIPNLQTSMDEFAELSPALKAEIIQRWKKGYLTFGDVFDIATEAQTIIKANMKALGFQERSDYGPPADLKK